MTESDPTRREALMGLATAPLLAGVLEAQASAPSICFMSTVEMARLIRTKKLSAREALAAHLKQIERVNPKVNAIVTLVTEMAAAGRSEGRRDANAQARSWGHCMVCQPRTRIWWKRVASAPLLDHRFIKTTFPFEDDLLVERLRRAGAITIGKTNTPEFGAGSQTFNTVFGATHNPYDLTKTCGGSSGGAAVALACGLVPVADGSDAGGSLRNPAAFCNIVGFRPSVGRVPDPKAAFAWSTRSHPAAAWDVRWRTWRSC